MRSELLVLRILKILKLTLVEIHTKPEGQQQRLLLNMTDNVDVLDGGWFFTGDTELLRDYFFKHKYKDTSILNAFMVAEYASDAGLVKHIKDLTEELKLWLCL